MTASSKQTSDGSMRDLLHVLFKHQVKILTIFLVTVVTVTAATFLITPLYESNTSLLVKIGREYMTTPEVGSTQNLMVVNREGIINSQIEILNSRDLIENVISNIGVGKLYPKLESSPSPRMTPLEAAVPRFSKALTVGGIKTSNVIRISFQHQDPVIAAEALDVLVDLFKEKHLEIFSNPQSAFLETQLVNYQQRLARSENSFEAFKQQHQIYSVDEQRSLLLTQQIELDTALKNTANHVEELLKQIAAYQAQLQDIAQDNDRYTQTERDRIIVDAQTRLLGLQLKEQELLGKNFRDDSRMVGSVRKEIHLVEEFLTDQERDIGRRVRTSNPVYVEIEKEMLKSEAELAARRAGSTTLGKQLAELDTSIQSLDLQQNEHRNLQRELEINERNYLTYAAKVEEARISDNLDRQKIASISVIQAPTTPHKPVKPKTLLNIMLGVILGATAGLAFAFFVDFMSQSFSTPGQAERRLHLPVLASIAHKEP